jgi:hypothetical protein
MTAMLHQIIGILRERRSFFRTPCPTCGGAATFWDALRIWTPYHTIRCRHCGARLGLRHPGRVSLIGTVYFLGLAGLLVFLWEWPPLARWGLVGAVAVAGETVVTAWILYTGGIKIKD